MTKIIVAILTVLLMFFPNSSFLLSNYQSLTFLGKDAISGVIVEAIENNDADTIEGMLSQYAKESEENLSQKIKELIAAVDGEIKEYRDYGSNEIEEYAGEIVSNKDISWDI